MMFMHLIYIHILIIFWSILGKDVCFLVSSPCLRIFIALERKELLRFLRIVSTEVWCWGDRAAAVLGLASEPGAESHLLALWPLPSAISHENILSLSFLTWEMRMEWQSNEIIHMGVPSSLPEHTRHCVSWIWALKSFVSFNVQTHK